MQADTIKIADIPLSGVIEINGQKFVKVRDEPTKGSQFLSLKAYIPPSYCDVTPSSGTMQAWNGCAALATPTATNFTQGPCLTDSRDGKVYEIRKFADGKCWMVDNLMYGGTTDNCAGVDATAYTSATYGGAYGSSSPSNRFGTGTYGNCRDPRVGGAAPCTAGSTTCGYYYNWQAAMQHSSASDGDTYSGPTTNVQGICPLGWHIPTGNTGGEFAALDIANGGTGTYTSTVNAASNFWRPGFAYKGIYSGFVASDGSSLGYQGSSTSQWSASENSAMSAWRLNVGSSYVYPETTSGSSSKGNGSTVRCIKN